MERPTPTPPEAIAAPTPPRDTEQLTEVPLDGTPLEKVSAYLRMTFAEADARGGPICQEDAEAVATLLAALQAPGSAMADFAASGEADADRMMIECQQLRKRPWRSPDITCWIERMEQYLAMYE